VQISNASNHIVKGATLVVSILVATLSWKFVETPFRTGLLMLKGRSAFAFAAVSAVMLTVLGVTLLAFHGLPSANAAAPSPEAFPLKANDFSGNAFAKPDDRSCPILTAKPEFAQVRAREFECRLVIESSIVGYENLVLPLDGVFVSAIRLVVSPAS
jgi:hypothetical protein